MRSLPRLLVACCLLAIGCTHDPLGPQHRDLNFHRVLWASKGYSAYEFTFEMICYCSWDGPVRGTVVNDSLIHATVIATGEAVAPSGVPTIDALFDVIDRGIATPGAVARVTYDPRLGFPREIFFDRAPMSADDEVTYRVSGVVRLD